MVVSELSIVPDGAVEGVETLSCESGEGDAGLKWKWKTDGEFLQTVLAGCCENFAGYRFPSVVHLAIDDSRTIQWRTTFVLEGATAVTAKLSRSISRHQTREKSIGFIKSKIGSP
ncbi:MAG: hypothetical protein CM15mP74_07030 [Halieaceae bacterium]|nr:MAG: hypothetical protein CM15mP74_07030 [Halieaceae bacterium]